MSSAKSVSTDNKPLESIRAYAEELDERSDLQAQRYQEARKLENIWAGKRYDAGRMLARHKANANGKKTFELSSALANYNTTCCSYRDAEINREIAAGSYLDASKFAGDMTRQAIIAEHAIG